MITFKYLTIGLLVGVLASCTMSYTSPDGDKLDVTIDKTVIPQKGTK